MDTNIFRVGQEAFSKLDPEMQVTTILVFLFVASRQGCNQKDLEIALGLTNATASRNVSYWTEFKSHEKPGLAFIERTEDPRDRRYKVLRLTPKGKAFYDSLREKNFGKDGGNKMAS